MANAKKEALTIHSRGTRIVPILLPLTQALGVNDLVLRRAEFWADFICTNSQFPAPGRLRDQFSAARFSDFCDCGCNSFAATIASDSATVPIAQPGEAGVMVFESAFRLDGSDKSLEILLFVDAFGNLSYVEIDCNVNSEPVPETIHVSAPPYHLYVSDRLVS